MCITERLVLKLMRSELIMQRACKIGIMSALSLCLIDKVLKTVFDGVGMRLASVE